MAGLQYLLHGQQALFNLDCIPIANCDLLAYNFKVGSSSDRIFSSWLYSLKEIVGLYLSGACSNKYDRFLCGEVSVQSQ